MRLSRGTRSVCPSSWSSSRRRLRLRPKLRGGGGASATTCATRRPAAPIPCKLTFIGVDGTRDPEFTRVDIGRQEGDGAIAAFNRVMSIAGVGVARVPLGTYDVDVSRGPEWEIATIKRLKLTAQGANVVAPPEPRRRRHGWLSADFHVHAARSSDSRVPMHDRIFEFVADDVRMIVATDHNVISRLRAVHPRAGRRPLHRQRDRRRVDDQRVGPLRRVSAAA